MTERGVFDFQLKLMQHGGSTFTVTWARIACGCLGQDGSLRAKG